MGRTNNKKVIEKKLAKKIKIRKIKKWGVKYHKSFFYKTSYDYIIDDKSIYAKKILKKGIQNKLKKYI